MPWTDVHAPQGLRGQSRSPKLSWHGVVLVGYRVLQNRLFQTILPIVRLEHLLGILWHKGIQSFWAKLFLLEREDVGHLHMLEVLCVNLALPILQDIDFNVRHMDSVWIWCRDAFPLHGRSSLYNPWPVEARVRIFDIVRQFFPRTRFSIDVGLGWVDLEKVWLFLGAKFDFVAMGPHACSHPLYKGLGVTAVFQKDPEVQVIVMLDDPTFPFTSKCRSPEHHLTSLPSALQNLCFGVIFDNPQLIVQCVGGVNIELVQILMEVRIALHHVFHGEGVIC